MDSSSKAQEPMDQEFVWDDYLENTISKAAPPTAFYHVEESIVNSLKINMKLEVLNPEEENCCWVASVVMICGPLLSLRYLGYGDDRSADFWSELKAGEFHPVGWSLKNNQKLYPPKGVRDRHSNYMDLIVPELEDDAIPASILEDPESGITPIDQIKFDMVIEIADELNYENMWPARIIQSVGGRLLVRYISNSDVEGFDFWIFYLSERVHPLGWGKRNGATYIPPTGKGFTFSEEEKNEALENIFLDSEDFTLPEHILEPQLDILSHGFKEKMKLEVLCPVTHKCICAATVTSILSANYFLVEVDGSKTQLCCSAMSTNIFPCFWAEGNGMKVLPPTGFNEDSESLDWNKYLSTCKAKAAPKELFLNLLQEVKFEVGMKLEAANPFSPADIHASTVDKVVGPLIWIKLDSSEEVVANHAVGVNSFDIFPVGWCGSNFYPLQSPHVSRWVKPSVQSTELLSVKEHDGIHPKEGTSRKSWCPKIYFNHCCFTGPFLSKSRLAELPQTIGPGPLHLVMKDVLTRLINIAYKSPRVLKELQINGKPNPNMLQQTIKAKYKGKCYRAIMEFIRNSEQIDDFCRSICKKLECCPHMFGPKHVGQNCPDNCYNLTKTKFGNGFVKKKTNGDGTEVKRGPGRRKKRKHWRCKTVIADDKQETKDASGAKDSDKSTKDSTSKSSDTDEGAPPKKKFEPSTETKMVTRGSHKGRPPKPKPAPPPVKPPGVRKVGRPPGSTKKALAAAAAAAVAATGSKRRAAAPPKVKVEEDDEDEEPPAKYCSRVLKEAEQIGMPHNPLDWSVDDVVKYIRSTPCAPLASLLREQEIDGQALLMLSMYTVREFLHLRQEPAKVFCSLVEKLKYEFFMMVP